MLKPFDLSVVVSDAKLARVTIVESPIHMVILSTLAVQTSISAFYHSSKSTERRVRYQIALKKVDVQRKSSEVRCRPRPALKKTDGPVIKPSQPLFRAVMSITALVANLLPWNFVKFADY